jgi:hypothetical protein
MKTRKKLFLITVILVLIMLITCSCTKQEPIQKEEVKTEETTTSWEDEYSDGGTLDGGSTGIENPLIGTKWVLTKMVSAFATEYPNDTITFVDNDDYTYNTSAVRPYSLSVLPSSTNFELTLYYFAPFGGSHYGGQVGQFFVEDGEINNAEFINLQDESATIRAWFVKIQ